MRHNTPFHVCSEAGGDYMTVGAVDSHNTAEVLTVSCKAAVRWLSGTPINAQLNLNIGPQIVNLHV